MEYNEKIFKFKILGPVKAKQSVKFAQVGNYMRKYTPKYMVNYANWVKTSFLKEYPNHTADELEGYYLDILIEVYVKIPKSFSNKKRQLALINYIRPDKKPDWDNISKNICDALNGIAYPDDKSIVIGRVIKSYDTIDYVHVSIKAWKCEL